MASKKVIKFYATWCGPCKVYGKVWDKVTPTYTDQIQFANIDIDKEIDQSEENNNKNNKKK